MSQTGGTDPTPVTETTGNTSSEESDTADPHPRIAVLEAENRQLRQEYARARQTTYRRTALGLLVVGLLGLVGGVVFPDARTVLFALGGTGIFSGVLTYVITPERFIAASVGTRLFEAVRAEREALIDELGLRGEPVYVRVDDAVRLFIPRQHDASLPAQSDLTNLFVVPDASKRGGVALYPTGGPLFSEFIKTTDTTLGSEPQTVAPVVTDAVVDLFELADSGTADIDTETNRITFEFSGAGLGDPTAIDHPIASFLAVSLVTALTEPLTVEVTETAPLTVTCRYGHQAEPTATDEP
ncbi:hypothetical protein [Halorubrum laminariae]|uniref:DUF7982 domain-containing protein n=1 Tax=Halorubrum laminariae TaxID=1433523 RepID=A0ABD6BZH8_9EURY|nr:hypothetical protein [Halorubrum laminariae]